MHKVNYMIGTWSGNRSKIPFDDGFLRRHLDKLAQVDHSLSQISIGYPHNPNESKSYTDWILGLNNSHTKNGTPIVVHPVPNIGRSYGQWSRMFDIYRDKFTHYIFIEDDYVPVRDGFDKILVNMFESKRHLKCGYLCGLILDETGRYGAEMKKHAAISNGISSTEVLEAVWEKHGCLPHDKEGYSIGQVLFSEGFPRSGYTIQEYLDHYRCLYWQHSKKIRWYWDGKHNNDLIVPIQFLDNPDIDFEEFRPETRPEVVVPPQDERTKRSFQLNKPFMSLGRRRALGY